MSDASLGFLVAVAVRTAIVLVALVAGLRLFGTRQIGEMNTHDVLLVLILANAVQNAMTTGSGQIAVALLAAGTLILLGRLAAVSFRRWPSLEERLMGAPTVIVHDGQVISRSLRAEGLTLEEVRSAVRAQGLEHLDDVKLAVLEMDGSISVIPRERAGAGG